MTAMYELKAMTCTKNYEHRYSKYSFDFKKGFKYLVVQNKHFLDTVQVIHGNMLLDVPTSLFSLSDDTKSVVGLETNTYDYIGNSINIGDIVIFIQSGYRDFVEGIVTKIGKKLTITTDSQYSKRTFRYPNQVILKK
jgi:hypothetical protein